MKYWWVNQNQTHRHEIDGSYLWSPKVKKNGQRNYFYDTMTQVRVGDMVFSFFDTKIMALGIVTGDAESAPTPEAFGKVGAQWSNEGWLVHVDYRRLDKIIRPADHMAILGSLLPDIYSPLQANGNGNQGVYLTQLPENLAEALGNLIGGEYASAKAADVIDLDENESDTVEKAIRNRVNFSETEKLQLTKSRRGQGIFRTSVALLESMGCRLTGVKDKRYLRASHIKPWKDASDFEKLDGNNGLFLAPHVDHLFDKGFISFDDDGRLLISDRINRDVFLSWGLKVEREAFPLSAEQARYMAFHREKVFLR